MGVAMLDKTGGSGEREGERERLVGLRVLSDCVIIMMMMKSVFLGRLSMRNMLNRGKYIKYETQDTQNSRCPSNYAETSNKAA